MKTKGALGFRVKCKECGGKCRVYGSMDATRYFECQGCGRKFKLVVDSAPVVSGFLKTKKMGV